MPLLNGLFKLFKGYDSICAAVIFLFVYGVIHWFSHNFLFTGLLFFFTNIVSLFFLSYLGIYGVFLINLFSLFFFWFSLLLQFDFFFQNDGFIKLVVGEWFQISIDERLHLDLYVDIISFSFMNLTVSIALFVYCYAFSYFRSEPHVERLILFLNLFVASMVLLVCSGNIFIIFLGWELIGLTSFILINFWTTRVSTLKAAFKAFSFNKFSDISFLIFIVLCYSVFYDTDIMLINLQSIYTSDINIDFFFIEVNSIELICFFLVFSAVIKSAQIGSHIWLPDSMEAPVPASALIHSATLVSAGIYLILRFHNFFEISIFSYYILPLIGSITAFYGGFVACYQTDAKRILAYSTISHCGFLIVSCTAFCPEYTIFYLYVHGFFKAAAFLCVGNIIRFNFNNQDIRHMGGFCQYLPFEVCAIFICLFNLAGAPFTFGYLIKHLLISTVYSYSHFFYYLILVNILCGALTGILYCYRILFFVFFDFKKSKKFVYNNLQNPIFLYMEVIESATHDSWEELNDNWIYFSATTLASDIAILFLIINSYYTCFYLFTLFCNIDFDYSSTLLFIQNTNIYNNFIISDSSAFNLGFFNICVIIFFFVLLNSIFRDTFSVALLYENVAICGYLFLFFFSWWWITSF